MPSSRGFLGFLPDDFELKTLSFRTRWFICSERCFCRSLIVCHSDEYDVIRDKEVNPFLNKKTSIPHSRAKKL